jgi:uncharacterized protein (TIGR03083 family)
VIDHLALLEAEVAATASAFRRADLSATVASCPGWTVQELCNHLTAVHRWVLLALRDEGSPPYDESVPSTPEDYAEVAGSMVGRLHELAPDASCWTFDRENPTASFWRRRQLHEVAVHRWDVEQQDLDPAVAEDGVSEVVDFFLPRQVRLGRTTLPAGRLLLDAGTRTWTLVDTPGPEAVVTADAPTMNLLLWGRRTLDDVDVSGDAAFAAEVFSAALTP